GACRDAAVRRSQLAPPTPARCRHRCWPTPATPPAAWTLCAATWTLGLPPRRQRRRAPPRARTRLEPAPTRRHLSRPGSGRKVARVGLTAHIARRGAVVGHELLLAPSVSVLPVAQAGRLLLVRHAGHDDGWGVLGGAVDVGESPAAAAAREAREEISADVHLLRLVDV